MVGLLKLSVASTVMATSLFTRRDRNGWLDELDGIRGEALVAPDGELAAAMYGAEPLAETADPPGTLTEWIDPAGGHASFEAAVAAGTATFEASAGGEAGPPGHSTAIPTIFNALPPPRPEAQPAEAELSLVGAEHAPTTVVHAPPAGWTGIPPVIMDRSTLTGLPVPSQGASMTQLPSPPAPVAPAAAVEPVMPVAQVSSAPPVPPTPPARDAFERRPARPEPPELPVAPPVERATLTGLPAPVGGVSATSPYGDLPYASRPAPAARVDEVPSVSLAELPPPPSPTADAPSPPAAEPAGDADAQLARPVSNFGSGPATAAPHRVHPEQMWHPDLSAPAVEDPTNDERLWSPEAQRFSFTNLRPVGPTAEPVPPRVEEPDAGFLPIVGSEPTGSLIDGPVARRARREPSHPLAEGQAPASGIGTEPTAPVFGWGTADDAEPGLGVEVSRDALGPEPLLPPADLDLAAAVVGLPAPAVEAPGAPSVPSDSIAPRVLPVGPDGTVGLPGGHLRFGDGGQAPVLTEQAGTSTQLVQGWCWVSSTPSAGPIRVEVAGMVVSAPTAGTVLVTVESDGSAFVAVSQGTALLIGPAGLEVLGAGSVALVGTDGTIQVDLASPAELEADPVVSANLTADARR